MGMASAAGWAPCIGPVLATILATAAAGGTVAWGAALLILYSLGLGVPFVLLALGFARAQRSLQWLRRNGRRVELAGGALLVGVGVRAAQSPLLGKPAPEIAGTTIDGEQVRLSSYWGTWVLEQLMQQAKAQRQ